MSRRQRPVETERDWQRTVMALLRPRCPPAAPAASPGGAQRPGRERWCDCTVEREEGGTRRHRVDPQREVDLVLRYRDARAREDGLAEDPWA